LIIVLWNALILHARWGGMVKQRGMAVLAIFGNVVTTWSWFGTNMLGVGLHAYGFIPAAVIWMVVFITSQLILIGMGCLPLKYWRSFNVKPAGLVLPPPGTLAPKVPEGFAGTKGKGKKDRGIKPAPGSGKSKHVKV